MPHFEVLSLLLYIMKKLINPYLDKEGYNCFGCSPANPIGLHLEFWEDGEDVVATWRPNVNFDGWVETLHGGIISTLIDEIANWVLSRRLQTAGVTTKLEVKFRRPVSTRDSQITLRGRITGNVRNYYTVHVTLHDSRGNLCDEGNVTYCMFPIEKALEMGFTKCLTEEEAEALK